MFTARTLPALVVAVLLAGGSSVGAEPVGWGQPATPQWPDRTRSVGDQPSVPTQGRHRPWPAGSTDAASTSSTRRDALGQRTWNTLVGEVGEPPSRSVETRARPTQPPPDSSAGLRYEVGGVYGGFGMPFGSLGLDYFGSFYGSPYLYGLPGYGLGYGNSSPLGFGVVTPWAW